MRAARLLPLLLLFACAGVFATRIHDIRADPRGYDGREVTVSGRVTEAVNLGVVRFFRIDDGSGEITVITERSVPRDGEKVRVRGEVKEAFALAGRRLLVIVEAAR